MNYIKITLFSFAFALIAHVGSAAITFVPGDYYSSHDVFDSHPLTITQYDQSGNVVGSLTLSSTLGQGVQGLAFGPDNLLYAAIERGSNGFAVVALDAAGTVHHTYVGPTYIFGDGSGRIALDSQYLYLAGQNNLVRFTLGNASSLTYIYTNNQVADVKPLPNGHLLVGSAYQVDEITPAGDYIRTINPIGLPDSFGGFSFLESLEYDPATDKLYVMEGGDTDIGFDQLIRLDATTGVYETRTTFHYGWDVFLTNSGNLLVGSYVSSSPAFFDQNLSPLGMLNGGQQAYVTQYNPAPCQHSFSQSANFNGTKIPQNSSVWFNSVIKPNGLGTSAVTIHLTHQTITSSAFVIPVPDATITFDPAATTATTTFSGGVWNTRVPSQGLAGNTFGSGASFQVPSDISGGLKNVDWNGVVSSDDSNVSVQLKWAAAVYSQFSSDNAALGVKPVDDNKASQYQNSDHAGTPEAYKASVIGGATGGGGANYTGNYGGTVSLDSCKQQ